MNETTFYLIVKLVLPPTNIGAVQGGLQNDGLRRPGQPQAGQLPQVQRGDRHLRLGRQAGPRARLHQG